MDLIPTLRKLTRQATRCDDTVSVPVLVLLEAIGALERHDLGPVYARLRREVRAVEAEMERRFDENRAQVAELFQSQHREFGEYLNDLHRRVFPFETKPIAFDAYDPDREPQI